MDFHFLMSDSSFGCEEERKNTKEIATKKPFEHDENASSDKENNYSEQSKTIKASKVKFINKVYNKSIQKEREMPFLTETSVINANRKTNYGNNLTCKELYAILRNEEEKVILYDCRSLKEFKHRHIKNSIWFKNLQENITYINVTQFTKIIFVGPAEIVAKTVDLCTKGFNFEKNVCFGMIESVVSFMDKYKEMKNTL